MRRFGGALAEMGGHDAASWWLSRLLGTAWCESYFPLTGTAVGLLASTDDAEPGVLRLAVQPGPELASDELVSIVHEAGEPGRQVAEWVARLGPGAGSRRQGWEIALGAGLLRGTVRDFRLYVGTQERGRATPLAGFLREIGLWTVTLADDAFELVERVRRSSTLTGFSIRAASASSYLLYFACDGQLSPAMLTDVAEPLGATDLEPLVDFHRRAGEGALRRWGWAIGIGHGGELAYAKLEVSDSERAELSADALPAWIQGLSAEHALVPVANTRSCRVGGGRSSSVEYASFASERERRVAMPAGDFPPPPRHGSQPRRSLSDSVHAAVRVITALQHRDGSWWDFCLPDKGASGPWVTAHVGLRLAGLPASFKDGTADAVRVAATYLAALPRSRWSYNESSPQDADSLSHVLLFLRAAGCPPDAAAAAELVAYQGEGGGFRTFRPTSPEAQGAPWCGEHPDVTPLAVRALASQDLRAFDSRVERALACIDKDLPVHGLWPAFWWTLDWYTAAAWALCAAELGVRVPERASALEPARLETWLPLDLAHALEYACLVGWDKVAEVAADRLLDLQLENGLWPVSEVLRLPPTARPWEAPAETSSRFADTGTYSGATILSALARYAVPR